jgi:hypothetical protein
MTMAQEAPALFDLSDEELERRRQALSYAVIWGNVETSPALAEIERELDRRARARDQELRAFAAEARKEAWRRFEEHEATHQVAEVGFPAAEEAERQSEVRRQAEAERQRAEEERQRAEEERRRREEEERRKAELERHRGERELRRLAEEQLKTARLLDFGTGRIVDLAASFVEREDAMHELAEALGDAEPETDAEDDESGHHALDLDRFDQAQTLLGAILRSRLSAIPELRMQPANGHQPNGEKKNGSRPTLEGRTKALLEDLLSPPSTDGKD